MKSLPWDHGAAVTEVRDRIWTHLTPTAVEHDLLLKAGRLLQLSDQDVLALARVHFMISPEIAAMLTDLPLLVRRLATTTVQDEERSTEQVRGAIQWPQTISGRLATGQPHLYVTTPARRAYQTPENELLAFTLDQVAAAGHRIGWEGTTEPAAQIAARTGQVERWRSHRALSAIDPVRPTNRSFSRVRLGRNGRRYHAALQVFVLWQKLIDQLHIGSIRTVIEKHGLVTANDPVLFEILCLFKVLDSLAKLGWTGHRLRVFGGGLRSRLRRGNETMTVWYQQVPADLAVESRYAEIQQNHGFLNTRPLRPDMVLRRSGGSQQRWLLIEDKLGETRKIADSARAALVDLLAYRRAFDKALSKQQTYGMGIAWGADLDPATDAEIMLCSPDRMRAALETFAGA